MDQAARPTVSLTINGKAIQAEAGTTVFQAAASAGIFIPHYCYHPDLSIAGVCRMCMCDIEKNPKLQISCNTPVAEGMVVRTDTEKVKDTVKSVLELHLINHPLDCPICDKAGECKLQDFYSDYGLYTSRMPFDDKVHKPKVVDIGTIVLDAERCILCTRCVRFTAEVTKTNELSIFNRGDRSELQTYNGGPLENDYTGNLADICPVGALTAKDFRFQQRVWFLDTVESVCGLCARGCNTEVSANPKTKKLFRVEPRRNPEVNSSWICDRGRWAYHYVSGETRIKVPRRLFEGKWSEVPWAEGFSVLKAEIDEAPERLLMALSTQLTNEEVCDVVTTFRAMGVNQFMWVVDESAVVDRKPEDGILKHADLTANAMGFEKMMAQMGVTWMRYAQAEQQFKSKAFDRVIVFGLETEKPPGFDKVMTMVPSDVKVAVHATNELPQFDRADVVLPCTSFYEKSGTAINALGRLQKVNKALPNQFTARDAHAVVHGIQKGNDRELVAPNRAQGYFDTWVAGKFGLPAGVQAFRRFDSSGTQLRG